MDVDQAKENQLKNIESRSGKSRADLVALVQNSGLAKHGEIIAMLKQTIGLGHGDANAIALYAKAAAGGFGEPTLDDIYSGAKTALRPIHDRVMEVIAGLGEHEAVMKKGYVSLRRKKQFAMVGPATNTQVEIGLNIKGIPGTERLKEQPAGGMCQFKLRLASPHEVDQELVGWLKAAYEHAG